MLQICLWLYSKGRGNNILPSFNFSRAIFSYIAVFSVLFFFANQAYSASFKIQNNSDVVGEAVQYTVLDDETFYSIARKFDLGIVELMAANPGIDPWIPASGSAINIPTSYILPKAKHRGIVINLPELRLFYYPSAKTVLTFQVGIGREGWQTPIGETKIILKRKNQSWTPPASILATKPDLPKFVPAGPDNPLGNYAMNLGWESFLIHGTNKPLGIGLRSSHGCIRMYPEDIEVLFNAVNKGTPVTVIDSPYKLGRSGSDIYLEVTPTQEQTDDIANYRELEPLVPEDIYKAIDKITGNSEIDWQIVDEAVIKRNGIPVVITKGNKEATE